MDERFNERIFDSVFNNFLERVFQKPDVCDQYLASSDDIDIQIAYNPAQEFGGGSHLDYTVVYSLTENLIYNALTGKASQLNGTNFNGPRGIVLCDGSCRFLNHGLTGNGSYTLDEVIRHFLNENNSISFVLTCVVRDVGERSSPYLGPFQLSSVLYQGAGFDDIRFDLAEILRTLRFPTPKLNARNAINYLKGSTPHEGSRCAGEIIMEQNRTTVKISARLVLELLAGKISQEEFFRRCDGITSYNSFDRALRGGQLIVSLERSHEEDDDVLVFVMSGPDPAISPFTVPNRSAVN